MKTTKYMIIDKQHQAGVEIDGNQILLWIEQKYKHWFFGTSFKRVTRPEWFKLVSTSDRYGCSVCSGFLGRIMTLTVQEKNIDTFDLSKEIKMLFSNYTQTIREQNTIDKKLSQFINSI